MPIDSAFGEDAFGDDDEVSPGITDYDPPVWTKISSHQPTSFTVTEDVGLDVLTVEVSQGGWKTVYSEGAFTPDYKDSSVEVLASGWLRFTVTRRGGWLSPYVSFRATVTDTEGTEA